MSAVLFDGKLTLLSPKVVRCRVRSIDEFLRMAEILRDGREWVYRGQANSRWGLSSSLERAKARDKTGEIDLDCELQAIQSFMRMTRGMLDLGTSYIDYLCAMQHYGIPTRLVDFTRSLFVALYMAFEDMTVKGPRCKRAIWAVNIDLMIEESNVIGKYLHCEAEKVSEQEQCSFRCYNSVFAGMKTNLRYDDAEFMRIQRDCANTLLTKGVITAELGILPIDLPRNNQRLLAQDGLFLMPQTLGPFEKNLAAALGVDDIVVSSKSCPIDDVERLLGQSGSLGLIKVEIDEALGEKVRGLLHDANYTPDRVYPDVAGIVKHIHYR